MKITTKVVFVVNCKHIFEELQALKFRASIAYKIKKIFAEYQLVHAAFEDSRITLLEQFAKLDKKTDQYVFPKNSKKPLADFNVKINEEAQADIELDIPLLTVDELEEFPVDQNQLILMDWFVEDPYPPLKAVSKEAS